jgi:hypothetical protein
MRVAVICLPLALACYGCQSSDDGPTKIDASSISDLLLADDPKVCAESDVVRIAFNAADSRYSNAIASKMPPIRVDTVSATAINKDIHEVTCSANAYAKSRFGVNEFIFPIIYRVRPSLDKGGTFVSEILGAPLTKNRITEHLNWWAVQSAPQSSSEEISLDGQDEDRAINKSASSEPCTAPILHRVAAIEDPESYLEVGRTDVISQVQRKKPNLEDSACFKGGYCYPEWVHIKGKAIRAIDLDACDLQPMSEDAEYITLHPVKSAN